MSNSNYNFRTAFNLAKEEKKHKRGTEVDELLKEIISTINEDSHDDIYENMLEEILFLQTEDSDVDVYLKIPFPNLNDDDDDESEMDRLYQYLLTRTCSSCFAEACNFLDLVAKKLEDEGFLVKPYTGKNAVKGGKSFTVVDKPR